MVIARDGETLPIHDVLTGRGFITGKSGSGKSVSTNVILEGLLDRDYPFLIIDTDGEYWGLKELYQVLHLGAGERCDAEVDASDAETIVDVALGGQPVILDVSGYLRAEEARDLIESVLTELFREEKQRRQPFLLVAEEVHEYIPERGGLGDVGDVLIQIAKRGRKHGLGIVGVSQRPAAVDKDFITQCDWIVWHKLTWNNDTDVVARIHGSDAASHVQEFDPGEAFLMADWETELQKIRFTMKRSYDAGATPGMETTDPPRLRAVDPAVLERFDAVPDPDAITDPEAVGKESTDHDSEPTSEGGQNPKPSANRAATDAGYRPSRQEAGSRPADSASGVEPPSPDPSPDAAPLAFAVEFTNLFVYAFRVLVTGVSRTTSRLHQWIWGPSRVDPIAYDATRRETVSRRVKYLIALAVVVGTLLTAMILLGG